jgi:hypothetical protein
MTTEPQSRRRTRFAGAALLALALLAAGCGRPPEEAWLRFLGFKQAGKTISVFSDNLYGDAVTTVDADFENRSLYVQNEGGSGILVYRARVDYLMTGFAPPAAEHALNLFIAAPSHTSGSTTTSGSTGTLSGFPLAPASLKNWLIGRADDSAVLELTARVTFYAETDQGAKIETHGSIGIVLNNK